VPGPTAVGVALLLLAQKRSFWVAAAVAALVALALCRRRLLAPALVAVAGVVAVATLVGPVRDLWDREQARPQVDNVTSIRAGIFEASIDRWRDRPIVGNGLGVGDRELRIDAGQPGFRWNSHNEVGAALAATGVLGLAAVLWGHLAGLAGALRSRRTSGDPFPLVVVAGSLALLPFWRLYIEPVVVALPLLTVVFPTQRWWYVDVDRWLPGRRQPPVAAETGLRR
ncbi:MAG: O-antigen ligase family protein, partial [Actinomycetota bacterium]